MITREIRFGDSFISASGFIDTGDDDGDGVPNMFDVCDFTPPGAAIVTDPQSPLFGTLRHDSDGDCDCDLADYAMFQNELTGPNP
ncbi:MAG: hypothetical protein IIC02_12955 [Planctomycetes bacterium]|nr:hypothetical protein [Planctomycetota bacterium]